MTARHITRLDQDTVNKIAAGEVIQRPSNALKEIVENALDAGSTNVSVLVKAGGIALLHVQDNGHGIHKVDFPLVCERFATSKLSSFEDLSSMRTYGFRGEALASISFVAKVTVTSMVPGAACAYKASFVDGRMVGEPKPTAGLKGTLIAVEDMFYNVPARRAAFKNASEEYARILEVVQRYAILSAHKGASFSCKKAGETMPDVSIPARTPVVDSIGNVYGASIKRELCELVVSAGVSSSSDSEEGPCRFNASGWVSSANYSMKRGVFILFINGRLVDCPPLRRAMEALYADILPKGSHPFIYLSVDLPPSHVDVNVHPTKREVGFLHQDDMVSAVVTALGQRLAGAQASRTFLTHSVLPLAPLTAAGPSGSAASNLGLLPIDQPSGGAGAALIHAPIEYEPSLPDDLGAGGEGSAAQQATAYRTVQASLAGFAARGNGRDVDISDQQPMAKLRKHAAVQALSSSASIPYVPQKLVRVNAGSQGTLEKFMVSKPGASAADGSADDVILCDELDEIIELGGGEGAAHAGSTTVASRKLKRSRASDAPVMLTSVRQLMAAVEAEVHAGLANAVRRHVLVGIVDRHTSLLQYNTRLLLVNHTQLARELFYQQTLRLFGNVASFALSPPPSVAALITLALESSGIHSAAGAVIDNDCIDELSRAELAHSLTTSLLSMAAMLDEYFGIRIAQAEQLGVNSSDDAIMLTHLPRLVDGHTPVLSYTPDFLLQLAWDVDWTAEKPCFHGIAQALAAFYAHPPPIPEHIRRAMGMEDSGGITTVEESADQAAMSSSSTEAGGAGHAMTQATVAQVEAYRNSPESVYWRTAHVLFPAMRSASGGETGVGFMPPRKLARDHAFVQVACTEQLYRIFERC